MKTTTIKAASKGEYIRLRSGSAVYIRGEYVRDIKRYALYRFDDVNAYRYVKGDAVCFVGFDF